MTWQFRYWEEGNRQNKFFSFETFCAIHEFFFDNFFFCISNELKSVRAKYHLSLIHDSWNCDSLSIWSNLKIVDFSIVEIRIRQDTALWSVSILSFFFTFIIILQINSEKEKFMSLFFHILLLNSLLQGTYWRESTMLNDNNLDRKIY